MGSLCVRNIVGLSTLKMLEHASSYRKGARWGSETTQHELVALAAGKGGAYGVLKWHSLATGEVFFTALVIMVSRGKGEFCWKTYDEFAAPGAIDMPEHLFRMLTPIDELPPSIQQHQRLQATQWRKAVQDRLASLREPKPAPGDQVIFKDPVTFVVEGEEAQVSSFEVKEWGRRRRLVGQTPSGTRFTARISRFVWDNYGFSVVRRS